jgi:hypothetical protein
MTGTRRRETVQERHAQIHQHQIGPLARGQLQRLVPIRRDDDAIAAQLQQHLHNEPVVLVVFSDQYGRRPAVHLTHRGAPGNVGHEGPHARVNPWDKEAVGN